MRIKLTLNHWNNQILPFNYQYLISSWIYKTLSKADYEFADWLHNSGYQKDGKKFKLFTFGHIEPKRFVINKQKKCLVLSEGPSVLQLSFYIEEAMQKFVTGLFKDQLFQLSSGKFKVDFQVGSVEMLPKVHFGNTMRFRCISPICISTKKQEEKYAQYLSPEDDGYAAAFTNNLINKYQSLPVPAGIDSADSPTTEALSFQLLSEPKSKLFQIKGIAVRGYLYDFELSGNSELMELGYYGGFGEKGSGGGMGMAVVKK